MNVNRVAVTGNLTAQPEVRQLRSGTSLCRLRIACNTRRRDADGSWDEKPNYFDVGHMGAQADAASRRLSKGSRIALDGRLEWREWTAQSGEKRQAVEIIADNVEFLDRRSGHQAPLATGETAAGDAGMDDLSF